MQQRLSNIRQNRRRDTKNDSEKMGGGRRNQILVSLAVVMFLGIAVYFRLWSIDYSASSYDTELLRYHLRKQINALLNVLPINCENFMFVDDSSIWRTEKQWMSLRSGGWDTTRKQRGLPNVSLNSNRFFPDLHHQPYHVKKINLGVFQFTILTCFCWLS